MGYSKSSSKRIVYRSIGLPQETIKISNTQTNFTSQRTKQKRQNEAQNQQKEGDDNKSEQKEICKELIPLNSKNNNNNNNTKTH